MMIISTAGELLIVVIEGDSEGGERASFGVRYIGSTFSYCKSTELKVIVVVVIILLCVRLVMGNTLSECPMYLSLP